MMSGIYLFGNNNLVEILWDYLRLDGVSVNGVTLNQKYISNPEFAGLPIIPFEELLRSDKKSFSIILAIGYNEQNSIRERVFGQLKANNVGILGYRHKSATVHPSATVGEGTILLENVVIQPRAVLGKSNIVWSGAIVSHHSRVGDFNYIAPGAVILGRSRVGNNAFIGANSTIRNDIYVGDKTIIGANAFVDENLKKKAVFVPQKGFVLSAESAHINIDPVAQEVLGHERH